MAKKPTPNVVEYNKDKVSEYLQDKIKNAAAQVKRTKAQILEQDHAATLDLARTKGFSAKQVAEFINESGGGLEVSEAAVRAYYASKAPAKPAAKPAAAAPAPATPAAAPTPAKK